MEGEKPNLEALTAQRLRLPAEDKQSKQQVGRATVASTETGVKRQTRSAITEKFDRLRIDSPSIAGTFSL